MALVDRAAAVRVTLGSTTHLLSTQQLQRYPNSLLPSLAADPAVGGEIYLTLSPADWKEKADVDFVMELYRSGSLAQACKVLTPHKDANDVGTFHQLTAAVDYFQLPTQEVLSAAALASAIHAATGPSDLSPQLLRLHTLAVARQAARQVLKLHYTYRQDLGLWRVARYVVAVGKDGQGHTALHPFAYAPAAAKPLYQKCRLDYLALQDVDRTPASREWIGLNDTLLEDQHSKFSISSFAQYHQGSLGSVASVAEIFSTVAGVQGIGST